MKKSVKKKVAAQRKQKITAKDMLVATAIAKGSSIGAANIAAGLRRDNALSPLRRNLVDTIREEMQQIPTHTFKDDAERLVKFAGDATTQMAQVRATEAHIKMMGYDAPARVEINERRDIHSAVLVLHALADKAGVTPNSLLFQRREVSNVQEV